MESIRKKAGYLAGLVAAMKLDENDPENQFKLGIVSILDELTERVEAMDDLIGELNDYVESIDNDLSQLEEDQELFPGEGADLEGNLFPQEDSLRVIKNTKPLKPEMVLQPARCAECGGVFLMDGTPGKGKYVCPHCEKTVKTQRLTKKNTPVAKRPEE